MTNLRFSLRRLPNDLCSKVLKTMDPHEIIAYSFLSKKALSLVQSLGLSYEKAYIRVGWSRKRFDFGNFTVIFNWEMGGNDEGLKNLEDIPAYFDISTEKELELAELESIIYGTGIYNKPMEIKWSNQKMNIGEWVRHICSILPCEGYGGDFSTGKIRFDIQPLQNYFPKLREIDIKCFKWEPNEIGIQCAQNILRAFLPDVEYVILQGVPIRENHSIQHIGMANLKELSLYPLRNPKLDDFLTLNVEVCIFHTYQFSLRDLNRVFKLWKKGSFRKLKKLVVLGETIAESNVLLKGLQAEGAGREMEYTIKNCYGIRAKITVNNNNTPTSVFVTFTVSN